MTQKSQRSATGGSALDILGMSRRHLVTRLAAAGFSAPVIASILRESAFAQEATPDAAGGAPVARQEPGADPAGIDHLRDPDLPGGG